MNHKEFEHTQNDIVKETTETDCTLEAEMINCELENEEIVGDDIQEENQDDWKESIEPTHTSTINFIEMLGNFSKLLKQKTNQLLIRLRTDNKSVLIGLAAVSILSVGGTLTISNFISNQSRIHTDMFTEIDYVGNSIYPNSENYLGYPTHYYLEPSQAQGQASLTPEEIINSIINQINGSLNQNSNSNSVDKENALKEISGNLIEF